MKKKLLVALVLSCFCLKGLEDSLMRAFEKHLNTDKQILFLESFAVKMAEQMPQHFDRHIEGALKGEHDSLLRTIKEGSRFIADFKTPLFSAMFPSITSALLGLKEEELSALDKDSLDRQVIKTALILKKREFNEAFDNDFMRKIAQSCPKDNPQYLVRYFRSLVFCMRFFLNARYALDHLKYDSPLWFLLSERSFTRELCYAVYLARHGYSSEVNVLPIKEKAQCAYDAIWEKYDTVPPIGWDDMLNFRDGENFVMDFE